MERPMSLRDVLVVAPYNRQVARLLSKLPHGARVGTVDKFQGQQAPVVIYSTASSSAHDAPRGVGFLYDLHRLNVAVSRAKALTAIVASPELLDAEVHTPEQLRAVNALCHFVEEATAATLEDRAWLSHPRRDEPAEPR
jgi:AAA domain